MKIHSKSAWTEDKITAFLDEAAIPLRIACLGQDGFPIVCSVWYFHEDGALWSASHKNSHLVEQLLANPKVGIEIATNDYPYHGVRGKATIELLAEPAENVLKRLLQKYLGDSNASLAQWLMSRVADEYAIKITPIILNSWDFSNRMEKSE